MVDGVVLGGPFDFWDENGELEFHQGDVRIYRVDGEEYLFVGPVMYASTTERDWYGRNVFPYAKGRCLEIGLGLGVASKVILANPRVTHLLTVEKDENVIAAFGKPLHKHTLLRADVRGRRV
jgi:spermidine synthase